MKDFIIADIDTHLAASKNSKYKESIIEMYVTLACFLQENGLSHRLLLAERQVPGPSFRILRLELTEEGFELISCALHKWVEGVTTGKWPATDSKVLDLELKRLRQSKKKDSGRYSSTYGNPGHDPLGKNSHVAGRLSASTNSAGVVSLS